MKVFDCQRMPRTIQEAFFIAGQPKTNDCAVKWTTWANKEKHPVDEWLMENGAEDGEQVIILHWW